MATITEICTQIGSILLAEVDDIESVELDSYLPTVRTSTVAVVFPPLGLSGTVDVLMGPMSKQVHRIPCKLWIAVDPKKEVRPAEMRRGRDVCLQAAEALKMNPTLNGTVMQLGDGNNSVMVEWMVDETITQLGHENFLLGTLWVIALERSTLPCY